MPQSYETKPFYDVTKELLGEIAPRQAQGGVDLIGLPTSHEGLDYALGGWRRDEMYTIGGATGSGKLFYIMTPIPTPDGYRLAVHLHVGDVVIGADGKPTRIINESTIDLNPVTYRITFDTGETILAADTHQWLTWTHAARVSEQRANKPKKGGVFSHDQSYKRTLPSVVTTQQIKDTLRVGRGVNERWNHSIPVTKPLNLPDVELVVDPYVLGSWLGDGSTGSGGITGIDMGILDRIECCGYKVTHGNNGKSHHINGLVGQLRTLGVLHDKHIPAQYLRAGYQQRLDIMRGLMDTDGSTGKKGTCEITQKREVLAQQIQELAWSLGWKAGLQTKYVLYKGERRPYYRVTFTPQECPFHLARKVEQWKRLGGQTTRATTRVRYIVAVDRVEPVPMKCFEVDNPDHLFLIGEGMIPTHNSSFVLTEAMTMAKNNAVVLYLSLEMSAKILALRSLSAITGIPAMAIEKGNLKDETWKFVLSEAEKLQGLSVYFYDRSVTTDEWEEVMRRHKDAYGLDAAIVDYNALMKDKGNSPYERVTNISVALRSHAKEFDIPYLVAAQLNRASLSGPPTLSALKESGQVENDSGGVIFPYRLPRDEGDDPDPKAEAAKIIIAKNRHGPVGEIDAEFLPKQMLWRAKPWAVIEPPRVVQKGKK